MLGDPSTGLERRSSPRSRRTRQGLSLDAVSQPYISAGIDRFGGMVGGGIAFNFSDMLGNHNLYAQVSADTSGGGVGDIAKNTGVFLGLHEPVETVELGLRGRAVALHRRRVCDRGWERSSNGEPVDARPDDHPASGQPRGQRYGRVSVQHDRARRAHGRVHAFVLRRADPDDVYFAPHRPVLDDSTVTNPLAEALNMSSFSTALVTDSSLFGATSPVAGRARVRNLSDLRRSATDIGAGRLSSLFHAGAVLHDRGARHALRAVWDWRRRQPAHAAVPRYPEFVRGYGVDSFSAGECGTGSSCPTYDQLVGSRMLVGNIELRFPLLRPFGVSDRMYGPLPWKSRFSSTAA